MLVRVKLNALLLTVTFDRSQKSKVVTLSFALNSWTSQAKQVSWSFRSGNANKRNKKRGRGGVASSFVICDL